MGRKNVVRSFKMIDAGDLSGNLTSTITDVINLDKASIHINWSGTAPSGTFTVEARNGDKDSFYELSMGGPITVSGNTGDHQIVFNSMPFTHIRLQYTFISGVGAVTTTISAKTAGA